MTAQRNFAEASYLDKGILRTNVCVSIVRIINIYTYIPYLHRQVAISQGENETPSPQLMLLASLESTHGSTQAFDCPADCSGYDSVWHRQAMREWVTTLASTYVVPGS